MLLDHNDIMLDLETMDTGPGSAIVAIGACRVMEKEHLSYLPLPPAEPKAYFYRVVDLQSSIDAGLTVSGATIQWWMEQSDAARASLNNPAMNSPLGVGGMGGLALEDINLHTTTDDPIPLSNALCDLSLWLVGNGPTARLWGNGAAFDNVILRSAYEAESMTPPWKFWNDRCYRTVKSTFPDVVLPHKPAVAHHALHDAVAQARNLRHLYKELESTQRIAGASIKAAERDLEEFAEYRKEAGPFTPDRIL